jgi:hypothetical protein
MNMLKKGEVIEDRGRDLRLTVHRRIEKIRLERKKRHEIKKISVELR